MTSAIPTLLIVAGVIVGGLALVVVIVTRGRSQPALGSGETPSVPAKQVVEPPAAPGRHEVVHIRAGAPLAEQLHAHADAAERAGLRPFLEFGAVWCPPSRMFQDALTDPRMQAAITGIYLIRAELDDFSGDPLVRELRAVSVPVFYELAAEGRWTGRRIDGGAWGADTIENMTRTMAEFFAA